MSAKRGRIAVEKENRADRALSNDADDEDMKPSIILIERMMMSRLHEMEEFEVVLKKECALIGNLFESHMDHLAKIKTEIHETVGVIHSLLNGRKIDQETLSFNGYAKLVHATLSSKE